MFNEEFVESAFLLGGTLNTIQDMLHLFFGCALRGGDGSSLFQILHFLVGEIARHEPLVVGGHIADSCLCLSVCL